MAARMETLDRLLREALAEGNEVQAARIESEIMKLYVQANEWAWR